MIVARTLYAAILDRIEAQNHDVFSRRAETSRAYKIKAATQCAIRNPGDLLARARDRRAPKIFIPA